MSGTKMTQESLFAKYVRIFVVVSGYWLCCGAILTLVLIVSIATVFINKTLFSSIEFEAPLFITWFQCLTTVCICYTMLSLKSVFPDSLPVPSSSDPFSTHVIRNVLPLSAMFTCMIATNNLCLKYVSVAFYYVGRSLTTIFNVLLTYIILGEKTSKTCIFFCLIIVSGFLLGVDQENLTGSLSIIGTVFGVLGSLSLSLYSIYTKKTLPFVNQEVWLLSYYNNIYSSFLFIPLILINGELPVIIKYPKLFDINFWAIMTVGGVCGFAIGFLTSMQIKVTSPLTHNISGTAKACAQTVLATYWYQEVKPFLWWVSNLVVLFGSASYARVKQLDMERKHKQQNATSKV